MAKSSLDGKIRKDQLRAAFELAAEQHPVEYYKDLLQKFEEEQLAQQEAAAAAAATPKKTKKKGKSGDGDDVDMADGEASTKSKSKKRKADEDTSVSKGLRIAKMRPS